ncbi:sodium/calcium exchanger NCL2-like isoform X1 [Triticum dicoccoides]|uniref:sodium/calcium exchanger NCL2-like isoform X1 n=1 Tax=Triticum dicoccoides TaxID=85692 RepID=UPI001891A1EE|nr:sodium/calcium exchanger NCL2-like isoform X1 [Triticum dicoccoides]
MPPPRTLAVLLLAVVAVAAHGRLLASDGLPGQGSASDAAVLRLSSAGRPAGEAEEGGCEMTYGFLPCTETAGGNLFLALAYGFLMFKSATYLSAGSELLLEILGPGIVGGLFLPILGALPDALLILVSGLSGTKEVAQSQVLIGMGLLAGSTIMLLTILWGSCVIVGKCDLSEDSTTIDSQDTKAFSLFGSGVSTDLQTSYAARIMAISVLPFIVVQIPQILKLQSGHRLTLLLGLIVAVLLLLTYCLYQIFQPWIQRRKLEYSRLKHVMSGLLKHAQMHTFGHLVDDDGTPNVSVIEKYATGLQFVFTYIFIQKSTYLLNNTVKIGRLFHKIDLDNDGKIGRGELQAFIVGVNFEDIELDTNLATDQVMADFDRSRNSSIEKGEFVDGVLRWLEEAKRVVAGSGAYSKKFMDDFHITTGEEHNALLDKHEDDGESIENPTWTCFKAISLLLLGTAMAAAFADPLVDAVHNFSSATSIPSFFISFIAMPLATNSSEAVSAIIFASRKKQRTLSLTFSEVYGGVTMNNTLCLAVFLALVYVRGLTWDFSSEVLVIFLVCIIMGLFTSFRTKFPLWTCFVAFLLYPLSLVLVYILDYKFGWS